MRILIVDDDAEMREMLRHLLEAEGYTVATAPTAMDALRSMADAEPDLVLLDVVLESEDGRDALREMRLMSDVPIVFLTGRGDEIDRIAGLKMGADDYVVKPFFAGELAARIESVLRRSNPWVEEPEPNGSLIKSGELQIDQGSREVHIGEDLVDLTAKEFDLLVFLAGAPRQVFSRQQLLERVWSSSSEWQDEATITEHVRRLRRKIEADPDNPRWITTVPGVGYRFEQGMDR